MKPCRSFTADLDALATGILPPEEARAIEAHLAGCATCREQRARTVALCVELSAAGRAVELPDAAAWRLRRRVRMKMAGPTSRAGWQWQVAAAFVAGVVCTLPFVHRAAPPRPKEVASVPAADPPLTLLACERAAARSDAALEQIFSRDAARPSRLPGEKSLRAFSPAFLVALDQNSYLP